MIIIYQGTQLVLPLAACYLHFYGHQPVLPIPSPQWWRRKISVFHIIGVDRDGNMVCVLATGCHEQLYTRVLCGIGEIFNLPVRVIPIDQLVNRHYPRLTVFQAKLFLARIFPAYGARFLLNLLKPLLEEEYLLYTSQERS